MPNKSLTIFFFAFVFCFLSLSASSAQEITIAFTGETHAMLYPCNCPIRPDGGVARRATLIKELRRKNPNTLVLDSGAFFSGGLQDEYTQNTILDMERARVNLKAMGLMGYDAAAVGDDEFNFGTEFLRENITNSKIAFLSCNIYDTRNMPASIKPYIIKEVAGKKIGIIGVTNLFAKQKSGGLKFRDPEAAVKEAVSKLKKNNTDIIIVLSHLGESEDLNLIRDVEGIDILIVGHSRMKEELSSKINNTLILRPSWQGRALGELNITLRDGKIADYKAQDLQLPKEVPDDPGILSILPHCFSDNNCKKEGLVGTCIDPGTLKSRCEFTQPAKVSLSVITTKLCNVCNTQDPADYLKRLFPGLTVSYLYYPEAGAEKIIREFNIKALPVFLIGKEASQEKAFAALKEQVETKGDFYMLKPQFSGIAYFIDRKVVKGKLDLFISLYDRTTPALLDMIKEFNPAVHFLAVEKKPGEFEAKGGSLEVEEYLRSVCVQKYYPENFWGYISCRSKSIGSSWWQDCLAGLNTDKITACARGEEGKELLRKNIILNNELWVMSGPTYLVDNQEIFSSQGAPSKEEIRKIMKR